ncbi:MAG: DNA mismatch repair endonuclease MutL, partial [Oscillospiraceae bacterium]|nr:DNA mismatch repair endonuclease MutL [Oscillospiraceae bacterium]
MSVINILSPHVADLIAAGEVVERPASVIKELCENAVDAGARNITIEISGGGRSLISVTDDGCGMSADDAGVAFLRHATSKLHDERGLESIATLGFRGEALAAISSVSRIELRTRRKQDAEGVRVTLSAGDIEEMGPVGCPVGTTMSVRDLFYNTPARLKFMKSDRAETSACVAAALRCALGHPEISFRMIRDGEEGFFTPGDGQTKSAVYSLLGRENAMNMLSCSREEDGVEVNGFISAPHACRGNRAMQYFFINGRPFRSLTIQAAVEQAYKNNMLVGRFPACVLYITLGFGKVDVNVHPTKSEVKFSEEKKVFDCVYYAVLSTLTATDKAKTAEISLSSGTKKSLGATIPAAVAHSSAPVGAIHESPASKATPKADFYQKMSAEEFKTKLSPSGGSLRSAPKAPVKANVSAITESLFPEVPKSESFTLRSPAPEFKQSHIVPKVDIPVIKSAPPAPVGAIHESPAPSTPLAPALPSFRLIGEALNTYIIVETEGKLLLIDKHAAHERMIFDRLNRQQQAMSQSLLIPVTWRPDPESMETLEKYGEIIEKCGFEVESYGAREMIIRAVPADTEGSEIALLEEIVSALSKGHLDNPTEKIFHTIACKAAI